VEPEVTAVPVFPTFAAPAREDPAFPGIWDFESLGSADREFAGWRVNCPEGAEGVEGVLAVELVPVPVVPLLVERALVLCVTVSVVVVG